MRVDFSEGVFSAIGIEPVGSEMQSQLDVTKTNGLCL